MVPIAQLTHVLADAAEYVPAAHTVQVDESMAPVATDAVPAEQEVQLDAPVLIWYIPEKQIMHAEAPDAETLPEAQFAQLEPPVTVRYVPDPQGVHPIEVTPE